MTDMISRRTVLLRGLQVPGAAALLLSLAGCGGGGHSSNAVTGAVCADPNTMTDSEQSTRKGVGYVERSPNPNQVCGGCAFFHAGATGSQCGTCDVLSGAPVNGHGHCNSWSAKG
jgi:hypothetical protein